MKSERGYLPPDIEILLGLLLAVYWFANGARSVLFPSSPLDRVYGILQLIGAPGALYAAWFGYQKMKRAKAKPGVAATDWIRVIALNITIPLLSIWVYRFREVPRTVALTAAVAFLILCNALQVWAIIARNRRRNEPSPRVLMVWAVVLALAAAGASARGLAMIRGPEEKRLYTEFQRRMEQNTRDYQRVGAGKPFNPALYDARSFANLDAIHATSAALKSVVDGDIVFFAAQQKAEQDFRDRMLPINPGSNYLKLVDAQTEREKSVSALERDWMNSAMDLYSFAADHANAIVIRNEDISFSDDATAEFMRRFDKSKALYQDFQDKVQASLTVPNR